MEKEPLTLPEVLGGYAESGAARFHMPGHKGRGMAGFMSEKTALWDVTEISITDNLQSPHGAIAEGQKRLAAAYGAYRSYYVVNGSTGALQAMILSLGKDEKLLLLRDCHKSAVSAAILSGIETCFLSPAYNEKLDLLEPVTPAALDAALAETRATAVLVTSPNYYGLCADLAGLSKVAHAHGALLLVDGAHGAHFPFSNALPAGCAPYADLFCHSQHKTMNALTQAASLHIMDCRVRPEHVRHALSILQTTSPSYLLMTSIDWAIYAARRQDWAGLAARMDAFRARTAKLPGLALLPENLPGEGGRDPTRLVIDVSGRGITGREALSCLEKRNIYIEMADLWRIVLITSPEDDPAWYARLYDAFRSLPYGRLTRGERTLPQFTPKRRMSVREAALSETERVPLEKAGGRTAAEAIGVYPPGISLLVPGEILPEDIALRLTGGADWGAEFFGLADGLVTVVKDI